MELWVAGLNAWGQLDSWEQLDNSSPPASPAEKNTKDIHTFQKCLEDDYIKVLWIGESVTLLDTSHGIMTAGFLDVIARLIIQHPQLYHSVAIAGNDKMAGAYRPFTIPVIEEEILWLFDSPPQYEHEGRRAPKIRDNVSAVVANQTSFSALCNTGELWTWGDGRFPHCLGRNVNEKSPARIPAKPEYFNQLPTGPIKKVCSGGYVTGALTVGHDLYVWGIHPVLDLRGDPSPVDLDGADFEDFAIGNDHVIALTTDGRLFVVGLGSNGQLGRKVDRLDDWNEVCLTLGEGQRITEVHAGYKSSFIIVE
ncbi:RCC1 superfamily ATS1 domain protein [Blumeria hordei DH14]|uniref:RCC1 superfamily ATS1 domain protein n=1 Tax=Blumeria graminis f. sp. hordei (strain DH14) TaxID=546991 RepID=N1JCC8_BLUG1|nr:RCC1 superfamily ATS1 domain protein [Blumeria hordei DH14]